MHRGERHRCVPVVVTDDCVVLLMESIDDQLLLVCEFASVLWDLSSYRALVFPQGVYGGRQPPYRLHDPWVFLIFQRRVGEPIDDLTSMPTPTIQSSHLPSSRPRIRPLPAEMPCATTSTPCTVTLLPRHGVFLWSPLLHAQRERSRCGMRSVIVMM